MSIIYINPYQFPAQGLQPKFVSWIEAENPTIDQVTSNTITGTASVTSVTHGSLTSAWTNGTLAGASIPTISDVTIWLTGHRTGNGDGGTYWLNSSLGLALGTYNGNFWRTAVSSAETNIGNTYNGSVVSVVVRRAASSSSIEVFKNGSFVASYANSDGQAISAGSIASSLSSISFMSTLAVSNEFLTLQEIQYLHNNGNFRLWANV